METTSTDSADLVRGIRHHDEQGQGEMFDRAGGPGPTRPRSRSASADLNTSNYHDYSDYINNLMTIGPERGEYDSDVDNDELEAEEGRI